MLNQLLVDRVRSLTDVQFAERRKQVPLEIAQVNAEASARGMFHSSARLLQIHAIYSRELAIRVQLLWQSIVRVHRTLRLQATHDTRVDFKQVVREYANSIHSELTGLLEDVYQGTKINMGKASLDEARDLAVAKHDAEIDIYVDSLLNSEQANAQAPAVSTYNFYAPVGAVQTGPHAVANVVQMISTEDKAALLAALAQVKAVLEDSPVFPEIKRAEFTGIANECERELQSANPNSTKLMAFLIVLGTGIQTIANARPAYEALKAAVLPLGVSLP